MLTSLLLAAMLAQAPADPNPKPPADAFKPHPSWKAQAKSLGFAPKNRRAVVRARVALTDGALEHLLCREQTKEHESILASDAEPRRIHAVLLLTGAEPGHPV